MRCLSAMLILVAGTGRSGPARGGKVFSPTPHRGPPRATAIPSLVKFPRYRPESGWYLAVDPSGRYSIREDDGAVLGDHGEIPALLIGLTSVFACAAGVSSCAWSIEWVIPFFVLGGFGGVIIGFLLATAVMAVAGCEPTPAVDVHRVESTDTLGWRLCELVARLGRAESWIEATIDQQRLAPSILWTALGRALIVDRQYSQFRIALHHGSLPGATRETLMTMACERRSLAAVEAYLRQVLDTAIGIDQRRARMQHDRQLLRARHRQQGALRGQLFDVSAAMSAAGDSDRAADAAAGLAAEVDVVAGWLTDADAMLGGADLPFRASHAA
jgi:hypothetical protein